MSLPAAIINKTLGTTTQVNVKRYGDGSVEYREVTANKPVQRMQPGESDPDFITGLIKALGTVA